MNKIWAIVLIVSTVALTVISPSNVLPTYMSGIGSALEFTFKMAVIYAMWMGINALMDKAGINKFIAKIFKPLTKRLFKNESEKAQEYISLNLSANLLGMSGVATPLGIKAIESMDDKSGIATESMRLFTVINCTSIQLIPATVIAMRASAGSGSASDIILLTVIATAIATVVGVLLVKVTRK